ncbi:unnamed protein product [Mytilus edulis]|uniref:Uncharacterized protein n=1 Tax=Mytilus edulis TaxID=6550 RepID=A0A8S3QUU1_MYTED|nr:unnamed protein product [Mytilus edulis]
MEKFDILIRPITAVEEDFTPQNPSYYVPCMVKEKPECDIYEMFNVTEDKCKKSTWFCLKFSFLPPHLMHHLIASLCREYEVSKVFDPIQNKKVTALFRGTAVFDLQKTRLQKLLVSVLPNLIQIQVLEFRTNAVIKRGSFLHIADFVEGEIIKIISTRFKMTNVTFEKKWECGSINPECVTGSNDFTEEQNAEYFCETCTATHKFFGEWSNKQLSESVEESNSETVDSNQTVLLAKLYFHPDALSALKLSKVQTRKNSSGVLSKEEFNFCKDGHNCAKYSCRCVI